MDSAVGQKRFSGAGGPKIPPHGATAAVRNATPGDMQAIYTRFVEHSHDCFLVIDQNGHVAFGNPAARELFGETIGNLSGECLGLPFGPEGVATPVEVITAKGEPLFLEMSADAIE